MITEQQTAELTHKLTKQIETAIFDAACVRLGEVPEPADLMKRLTSQKQAANKMYSLDGVPLITIHPPEIELPKGEIGESLKISYNVVTELHT